MSVFLMIRIECPGLHIGDMNAKLKASPADGMNQIIDMCAGIAAGNVSALVEVCARETTQTVSADGAGQAVTYDKR